MPDTVDSASDQRTVNNVVRHEYRILTDLEKSQMKRLKDAGLQFLDLIDEITLREAGPGVTRETALAKTKIEEAVMWAVKHVTR